MKRELVKEAIFNDSGQIQGDPRISDQINLFEILDWPNVSGNTVMVTL